MDWQEEFYGAKYHLSVARRMLGNYDECGGKRFLIGVIREGARAAGKLVRAFLIREELKGNLNTFVRRVAPKYLDVVSMENLVKILDLERDQRMAKVEFARKDEILLEAGGGWKILKVSRLREFVDSIDDIVSNFPTDIKR